MNRKHASVAVLAMMSLGLAVIPAANALYATASAGASCIYDSGYWGGRVPGWYSNSFANAHASGGLLDVGGQFTARAEAEGIPDGDVGQWPAKPYANAGASSPTTYRGLYYLAIAEASATATAIGSSPASDRADADALCATDPDDVKETPNGLGIGDSGLADCLHNDRLTAYLMESEVADRDGNTVFLETSEGKTYGWPNATAASFTLLDDSNFVTQQQEKVRNIQVIDVLLNQDCLRQVGHVVL